MIEPIDVDPVIRAAADKVLTASRTAHSVYLNPAETCYVALVLATLLDGDPTVALSLEQTRKLRTEVPS